MTTAPEPLPVATAELVVGEHDLASQVALAPGDAFPAVFATARMVGLMEVAASRCLAPLMQAGEMSVGVGVDVQHTAPTPTGARVRATARFVGREGKLFRFEVEAEDEAGSIGRGTHTRAIVAAARLVAGAARRRGG